MTTGQTTKQLTREQVQSFYDNGYLVVREAIDTAVLSKVRDAAAELQQRYASPRQEEGVYYTSPAVKSFDEMMDGTAVGGGSDDVVLWRVDDLEKRMPEVALLKRLPFVHGAMESLLGPDVIQYNESFVTKPPRVGQPVLWHQDPSFKSKACPDPISTIDIYLDEADEENGCLWVVPGSHRQGVVDAKALMDEHGFDLPGAIPVRMKPGDVAFHDNGCLHGSKANSSDRDRRIVYLAFQTRRQVTTGGQFQETFIAARDAMWQRYRRETVQDGWRRRSGTVGERLSESEPE